MGKMYLFSAVHGVVVHKGKPVEGATVEWEYFWHLKDQKAVAEVKTNAKGEFQFPEATGSSFLGSFLPHEPIVEQTIRIKVGDKTYMAWAYNRSNYDKLSELGGKPISLICDLDSPPSHKGPDDRVYGICELR